MKKENINFIDKLENNLVFNFSRIFFWLIALLVIIATIISIGALIYSFVPPQKENIPFLVEPKLPIISYDKIKTQLIPQPSYNEKIEKTKKEVTNKNIANDDMQVNEVKILMDSLGQYFPNSWDGIYNNKPSAKDYYGNGIDYKKILVRSGLKNEVENFIKGADDSIKIHVIKNILGIIPNFEGDKREKALRLFFNICLETWTNYTNDVGRIIKENKEIELQKDKKFRNDLADKANLKTQALIAIGSGIILFGMLGLYLSFLSIERNTRILKNYLDKEKKNELL
jgi:hypothetical protein